MDNRIAEAWAAVVSTDAGQIIATDLVNKFGFRMASTYGGNGQTVQDLAWKEGQRSVVTYIERALRHDPTKPLQTEAET